MEYSLSRRASEMKKHHTKKNRVERKGGKRKGNVHE
jgi:hypothetical protein